MINKIKNLDKKKKTLIIIALVLVAITIATGSIKKATTPQVEKKEIKEIFELATVKAYYHNVAKGEKEKQDGIAGFGEKDRVYWMEYTGYVNIGIDMEDVAIAIIGKKVKITMPKAKVLDYGLGETDGNKINFISSDDSWFNKNPIEPEEEQALLEEGQQEMIEQAEQNEQLMQQAEDRAKELIENYIERLGDFTGKEYEIEWKTIEGEE